MDPRVARWIERDPDPETKAEAQRLGAAGDAAEIEQRFGARLEFGTAGLRGLLGAGFGRMNRLVVRETTTGLARYLLSQMPDAQERGVVLGYDGRRGSRVFAHDAALVLAAHGIRAYLGEYELATPVCAFGVNHLRAAAGVVVTASHNPPDYNGYKVYWSNGAQIIPPHDAGIAAAIDRAAQEPISIAAAGSPEAERLITPIGDALVESYLEGVAALSIHAARKGRDSFRIAYTPLHGVGARFTEAALARAGFREVRTVASQREPDGRFPTVAFPNPEEKGAMDAVLALARDMDAHLAMANDPDADRLAVAVRVSKGTYRMLTGNQIGVLLGADWLENTAARKGRTLAVGTSIVSSRLLGEIAAARGARYFDTLTGFKWIANGALALEAKEPNLEFVFAYEEALGYTLGKLVRDKDGVSALVGFAEMAARLAEKGQSALDDLERIHRQYGLWVTTQRVLKVPPGGGPTPGDKLRAAPPKQVAGRSIDSTIDLVRGVRIAAGGKEEPAGLPTSDVLIYVLSGGTARVIVRPSGTEPKIKCYYELRATVGDAAMAQVEAEAMRQLEALADQHQAELAAL